MRRAPVTSLAICTAFAIAVTGFALTPDTANAFGRKLLKDLAPNVVTPNKPKKPRADRRPNAKRPDKKIAKPDPKPVRCKLPAIYVKRLGKCIKPKLPDEVVKPVIDRQIVVVPVPPGVKDPPPQSASCQWPTRQQGSVCVCVDGYKPNGKGGCYQPEPEVVIDIDVRRIQECLTVLAFNPGPIDGLHGPATRGAWRAFQEAHGLTARPPALTDKVTEVALFQKCAAPDTPESPLVETVALTGPALATPIPSLMQDHCLPADLHAMLVDTYGPQPNIAACTAETAACLPKPAFFDAGLLGKAAADHDVQWCDSCVSLNAWLPLAKILEIEAAANITLCAAPPALCYLPARPVMHTKTEVRTIYESYPVRVADEGDIAVVVGNEDYGDVLHRNIYGHADADAMLALLTEQLGYEADNVIDLRDASRADFERVFGSAMAPRGELADRLDGDDPGDVIVYVSSHGMADDDGAGYLLPVDVDTERLAETAYPLQQLHANLGRTGARTVMLMLEATFAETVTDIVDAPNLPEMEVMAMPSEPIAGLAVFTAADRDQQTLEDPEYGIGLFTRHMIAGLAGAADAGPIGNGDSRIDTIELFVYTADRVRMTARKSFGLEQKPMLSKIDNLVVGELASAQ
ncbi:caspase family protein [Bauldia sp.]|uniref:caspase family protein n=1 Tax=Bauldia sp. TaxID=2575872 RepID=UPI003BAB4F62